MSIVLIVLLVIVVFFILTFAVLTLITLPTLVQGWRQRREDEFYLAERLSAEVKAARHRDVR